ncbi:hypothetical protein ACEPPN_008412 [Leptodophora sp. 'Broadleaf-Isolate-01']
MKLPWDDSVTIFLVNYVDFLLVFPFVLLMEFIFDDLPWLSLYVLKHYYNILYMVAFLTYGLFRMLSIATLSFFVNTVVWLYISCRLCLMAYTVYLLGCAIEKIFLIALQKPMYFVLISVAALGYPWLRGAVISPVVEILFALNGSIQMALLRFNMWLTGRKRGEVSHAKRRPFVDRGTQTDDTLETAQAMKSANRGTKTAGGKKKARVANQGTKTGSDSAKCDKLRKEISDLKEEIRRARDEAGDIYLAKLDAEIAEDPIFQLGDFDIASDDVGGELYENAGEAIV